MGKTKKYNTPHPFVTFKHGEEFRPRLCGGSQAPTAEVRSEIFVLRPEGVQKYVERAKTEIINGIPIKWRKPQVFNLDPFICLKEKSEAQGAPHSKIKLFHL